MKDGWVLQISIIALLGLALYLIHAAARREERALCRHTVQRNLSVSRDQAEALIEREREIWSAP